MQEGGASTPVVIVVRLLQAVPDGALVAPLCGARPLHHHVRPAHRLGAELPALRGCPLHVGLDAGRCVLQVTLQSIPSLSLLYIICTGQQGLQRVLGSSLDSSEGDILTTWSSLLTEFIPELGGGLTESDRQAVEHLPLSIYTQLRWG